MARIIKQTIMSKWTNDRTESRHLHWQTVTRARQPYIMLAVELSRDELKVTSVWDHLPSQSLY